MSEFCNNNLVLFREDFNSNIFSAFEIQHVNYLLSEIDSAGTLAVNENLPNSGEFGHNQPFSTDFLRLLEVVEGGRKT